MATTTATAALSKPRSHPAVLERVRIIADLHLANHRLFGGQGVINARAQAGLDAFEAAMAPWCSAFIVAGDVFDSPRPTPALIGAFAAALGRAVNRSGDVPGFLMVGNHDCASAAEGDNALAVWPMRDNDTSATSTQPASAYTIAAPTFEAFAGGRLLIVLVPFRPGQTQQRVFEDVRLSLARAGLSPTLKAPGFVAVVSHAGIAPADAPPWLRGGTSLDEEQTHAFMRAHGVHAWFSGDWHGERDSIRESTAIYQIGALVPTGFDNPGPAYGRVLDLCLLGDGAVRLEAFRVGGPRFHTVSAATAAEALAAATTIQHQASPGDTAYVRLRVPAEALAATQLGAADALLAGRVDAVADTGIDPEQRTEALAMVASVKRAATLDEAIAVYVEGAPSVPEGSRDAVLANVRRLVASAGRE